MDPVKTVDRPLLGIPVVARRIGLCAATLVVSLVIVSACGSSTGKTASTPVSASTAAPATASAPTSASTMQASASMIMIEKYEYTSPITVAPGAVVSVMNMDSENHTVTADNGNAFDVKAIAGTTVTFAALRTPGRYAYHCAYHSEMHGTLIVK